VRFAAHLERVGNVGLQELAWCCLLLQQDLNGLSGGTRQLLQRADSCIAPCQKTGPNSRGPGNKHSNAGLLMFAARALTAAVAAQRSVARMTTLRYLLRAILPCQRVGLRSVI
jgi:hypothetical protein